MVSRNELVRTTQANLSHAIRWLNVTYAIQFNWAHRTRGTVFQGRFKSVLIQDESRAIEVARYIHLNPVRIGGLGLSQSDQRKARVLGCANPGEELVKRRLETLREHRWSSWRIYMGAEPNPGWLQGDAQENCFRAVFWKLLSANCQQRPLAWGRLLRICR